MTVDKAREGGKGHEGRARLMTWTRPERINEGSAGGGGEGETEGGTRLVTAGLGVRGTGPVTRDRADDTGKHGGAEAGTHRGASARCAAPRFRRRSSPRLRVSTEEPGSTP